MTLAQFMYLIIDEDDEENLLTPKLSPKHKEALLMLTQRALSVQGE